MSIQTFIALIVLTLAGHRVARVIGWDSITQPWRQRFLGYDDDGKKNRWPANRKRLGAFVHCPWCQGFWLSLVIYAAWRWWPEVTLTIASPLAVSSLIGVYTHHLDA